MLIADKMQYAQLQSPDLNAGLPQLQRSMSWQPQCSQISAQQGGHADSQHSFQPSAYDMRFGGAEDNHEDLVTNAVTKHPKVKLKIILSDHQFEAGGSISGALEITSSTSQRLRLGEIAVELEAFEELNSRDHSATQIFLFNRTLFQGEHLPPSNAVLPSAPVHGHWTARKGRTTFPFSFRLPTTVPSSVNFAGNAHLRYAIKGSAQTWWNESKSLVTVRSETAVLEKWQDEFDPRYLEPIEAVADSHIFMGGSGSVWLEAGVSEQLFSAGGPALIRAGIKNNTKRHISGIKVAIARRLILGASGPKSAPAKRDPIEPQIREVMHTQIFKGQQFEFPPGEEVMASLTIQIPREIRTIRKTRLFEVEIVMQVSAQMGNFAKDLMVEFPIFVAHPLSLSSLTQARSSNPLRGLSQRSRSAMSQHGYHDMFSPSPEQFHPNLQHLQASQAQLMPSFPSPQNYHDPRMTSLQQYGDNRGCSPAPVTPFDGAEFHRPMSGAANVSVAPPAQWASFQEVDHSQSLYQYYDRPHSAMELARQYNSTPQATTNDMSRQQILDDQNDVDLNFAPRQDYSRQMSVTQSSMNQPKIASNPAAQPLNSITMSQLLNLGAVPLARLTTIEEDSESAAGTIKSIRDVKGSITRMDVANLEAIASMTEISNTNPENDAVPAEVTTAQEMDECAKEEELQCAVTPSSSSEVTVLSDSLHHGAKSDARAISTRPTSAQGLGLSALESRLGSQKESKPVVTLAKIGKIRSVKTGQNGSPVQSGALRAAAVAAAQRQSEAREEVRRLEMEIRKQGEEAKGRDRNQDQVTRSRGNEEVPLGSSRREPAVASEKAAPLVVDKDTLLSNLLSKKERKVVDVIEQKKLNKEAVGRVAGWLSSSSSPSKILKDQKDNHVKKTARSPSPSLIEDAQSIKTNGISPPTLPRAVNGASSKDNEIPSLSPELRALIDSSNLNPPPKAGKAIKSHLASQRFSTASKEEEGVHRAAKSNGPSHIANRPAHSLSPFLKHHTESDTVAKDSSVLFPNGETKYDVRSARGGRGGKVASVANMWASIADGTDGSQAKNDAAPVLTLRPKALRGSAAGSAKLDFSKAKAKAEEPRKLSAKEIFSSSALDKEDQLSKATELRKCRNCNPPLKTAKAAHFINTTMPKPVFAKVASPKSPLADTKPTRQSIDEETAAGKLRESRKVVSDLIALQGKLKTGGDISNDEIQIAVLPMNGRGTTKAIGREKLADLRSLWGG